MDKITPRSSLPEIFSTKSTSVVKEEIPVTTGLANSPKEEIINIKKESFDWKKAQDHIKELLDHAMIFLGKEGMNPYAYAYKLTFLFTAQTKFSRLTGFLIKSSSLPIPCRPERTSPA